MHTDIYMLIASQSQIICVHSTGDTGIRNLTLLQVLVRPQPNASDIHVQTTVQTRRGSSQQTNLLSTLSDYFTVHGNPTLTLPYKSSNSGFMTGVVLGYGLIYMELSRKGFYKKWSPKQCSRTVTDTVVFHQEPPNITRQSEEVSFLERKLRTEKQA